MAEPLERDEIVEIAKDRERSLGTGGRMLLPCPATVAAVVKRIPRNKVVTTELIRKALAKQFEVDTTCPFNTKLCLQALANDPRQKLAYWRVIKANGELMNYYPGGVEGQAALLKKEGFAIDKKGKTPKVKAFKENLFLLSDNKKSPH
jgi:alkylated DNA nucleotide flippase Atl1